MMLKKLLFVLSLTPSLSTRMRADDIASEPEAEGQGKGKTIVAEIREPPVVKEAEIVPIRLEKKKPEPKMKTKRAIIAEIPVKEEKHIETITIPHPVYYPRPHYHSHPVLTHPPQFVGPYPHPGREYILPPAELIVPVKATIAALTHKYPPPPHPHPHPHPHMDPKDPRVAITLAQGGDAGASGIMDMQQAEQQQQQQYSLQSQYQEPTDYNYLQEAQWAQAYMPQYPQQQAMSPYQWTWSTSMADMTSTTPTPA